MIERYATEDTEMTENKWDDLKVFDKPKMRAISPVISILPAGVLSLNSRFLHDHKDLLESNTHALLSYSKVNNAVVFQFKKDETTPGAIKMTKRKNISIASRSFFNAYSLDPKKLKGRYKPVLEDIPGKGSCWVIYLDENLTAIK